MDRSTQPEPREPELIGPELEEPRPTSGLALPLLAVTVLGLSLALGAAFLGDREEAQATPELATRVLEVVPSTDRAAVARAVDGLAVTPAERDRIGAAVAAGDLQLGYLTLWDYRDHDGDVVAVSSAGFLQSIEITKVPKTIVVPFDGQGEALVTGLRDGGGGITIALATPSQPMQLRPLMIGESMKVAIP